MIDDATGWGGAVSKEPLFGYGNRRPAEIDDAGSLTELQQSSNAVSRQRRSSSFVAVLQSVAVVQRISRGFIGRRRFHAAKLHRQLRLCRQALTAEDTRLLEDVGRLIAADVRRALSPSLSPLLLDDERVAVVAQLPPGKRVRRGHAEAEDAMGRTGLQRLHDAHRMLMQCMMEVRVCRSLRPLRASDSG
jgi:hypothetical protein